MALTTVFLGFLMVLQTRLSGFCMTMQAQFAASTALPPLQSVLMVSWIIQYCLVTYGCLYSHVGGAAVEDPKKREVVEKGAIVKKRRGEKSVIDVTGNDSSLAKST